MTPSKGYAVAVLACPGCGRTNPTDARFCSGCGASISAETAAQAHRKNVTVVFADLVGSTALGGRLDPETSRHLIERYFAALRSVIERHGGTVEKFIGDAVMAVFGIPTLHEDDALRAVRAAAEMHEALDGVNGDIARYFGATDD